MTEQIRKILYISVDQWRGECLSALGHPLVKTPYLDALAADGVLFKRHYAACAPCGPARASLHTGMYLMNHRSGRNGTPLDDRFTNVAREARKAGFDPTLFGHTDTSMDPRTRPADDPALKTYEGVLPGFTVGMPLPEHMATWIADLKARGYDLPNGRWDVYKPRPGFQKPANRGHSFTPPVFTAEESETTFMADAILRWLSVRRDENWFVHGVFLRPHPPVIAPEPYNALYDPAEVPPARRKATPDQEAEQHPFLKAKLAALANSKGCDEHNPNNPIHMPELEVRQMRATYYGMITHVDDQIGRLIAHLKATGEYEDTLIILTCDHGEMGGDHYCWGKETYFEQSFHIPLIIRDPRRVADRSRGAQADRFTEAVDILPTILDWLGRPVPEQCDGRSLLPFLEGTSPPDWRKEMHYELDFRFSPNSPGFDSETALGLHPDECYLTVLRDEHYKYVHFVALPPLLFDLRNDPHEMSNLAEDPAHRDVLLTYAQRMLSWRMRHADRTLANLHLTDHGVVDGRLRHLRG
ncbi:MAG: alkaline phosphatase family protein [Dongiaceae bacterium]